MPVLKSLFWIRVFYTQFHYFFGAIFVQNLREKFTEHIAFEVCQMSIHLCKLPIFVPIQDDNLPA